ncbi:MAG TPA: adenylate kinase [Bacillota bacterium]|nr:adenylate kinase [Bacillota bacterium]HPF42012.1 adenylate kinase [Bacillota bacterium]HPJ85914.1 adenylate kinase [Bacillota bacterium]HPQ61808.1 adenylate kinase [Bacillota bacterium]HRX91215.1 adenylate kinase [Candidatus Izemoplasmatales bacterium]
MTNLLIMGKPGAGKGTLAAVILENYHLKHISTGDIYREEMQKESPIGLLAKSYINGGKLVPDDITNEIVENVLKNTKEYPNGFMLDGYPRTISQAGTLDKMLTDLNLKLDLVVNVDISEPVLMRRITGRRICSVCQETYHIENKPPKVPGICDVCGGTLIQRKDDTEEAVATRLAVYNEKTKPLLEYYQDKEMLFTVNGELPAEVIFKDIVKRLEAV